MEFIRIFKMMGVEKYPRCCIEVYAMLFVIQLFLLIVPFKNTVKNNLSHL